MTIRLGVLAASRIANGAIIEPIATVAGVDVVAVAARSAPRAEEAAHRWGLAHAFGSYRAMLESDAVDAVYIATPAALHRPWAVAALEAGKHVLVEKPIAANAQDARRLADAAERSGRVAMEALHWRYHPLVDQMRAVLDAGVLGALQRLEATFLVRRGRVTADDIRFDLGLGGGSMMDCGVYPATWVRWVMGCEPTVERAVADCPVPGVDVAMTAELTFPGGVRAQLACSMDNDSVDNRSSLVVIGSEATMTVENPIAPQRGALLRVEGAGGGTVEPVSTEPTYRFQLEAFRDAIVHGAPYPTTAADAVRTMELVDACYRAAGLHPRPSHPS